MSKMIGIDLSNDGNCAVLMGDGDPFVMTNICRGFAPSPAKIIKDQKEMIGVDGKAWSIDEQLALYFINIRRYAEKNLVKKWIRQLFLCLFTIYMRSANWYIKQQITLG